MNWNLAVMEGFTIPFLTKRRKMPFNIAITLCKTVKALSDQNVAVYKRSSLDKLIHLRDLKRVPSPVLQLYI